MNNDCSIRPETAERELPDNCADAFRLALACERAAITHGLQPELAQANLELARCFVIAGHFDRALGRLGTALRLFRALGDQCGELRALRALASFHLGQGQYSHMFVYLEDSLQLMQPDESADQIEWVHLGIAEGHARYAAALTAQGRPFEARAQCERALALLPRPDASTGRAVFDAAQARMLDTAARLHLLQGHTALASGYALELLRSGRSRRSPGLVAAGCDRLADIRMALCDHRKALPWLMRSQQSWAALGMHSERVTALDKLSAAHAALGRFPEAAANHTAARRIDDAIRSQTSALHSELAAIEADAEQRQRAEKDALEHTHRLAALGRMVVCIAHELTQPLAAMRLLAETLSTDHAPARAGLNRIVKLVDQSSVCVQHLKRFSRRDSLRIEPVRLSTIIDDAIAIVEPKRRSCDAVLDVDVDVDVDERFVLADSARASSVLVNLLCNALDAVAGTQRRTVGVRAAAQGDRALIEVRDHGPGLSPRALARLFEPHCTTKPIGEGSGLGLSISMDLARRMGASLRGANHPEGGALFTLDLALAGSPAYGVTPASEPLPSRIEWASQEAGASAAREPATQWRMPIQVAS